MPAVPNEFLKRGFSRRLFGGRGTTDGFLDLTSGLTIIRMGKMATAEVRNRSRRKTVWNGVECPVKPVEYVFARGRPIKCKQTPFPLYTSALTDPRGFPARYDFCDAFGVKVESSGRFVPTISGNTTLRSGKPNGFPGKELGKGPSEAPRGAERRWSVFLGPPPPSVARTSVG